MQLCGIGVALDGGAEGVAGGVEQFEAFAEVGQSDARAAAVVVLFGVVAVGDVAGDGAFGVHGDGDADEGGGCRADAVFEGIFHQGDEQQRGNVRAFGGGGEGDLQIDLFREAQAHQFDVVAHEVEFFV